MKNIRNIIKKELNLILEAGTNIGLWITPDKTYNMEDFYGVGFGHEETVEIIVVDKYTDLPGYEVVIKPEDYLQDYLEWKMSDKVGDIKDIPDVLELSSSELDNLYVEMLINYGMPEDIARATREEGLKEFIIRNYNWVRICYDTIDIDKLSKRQLLVISDELLEYRGNEIFDEEFTIKEISNNEIYYNIPFDLIYDGDVNEIRRGSKL